MTKKEICIK